MTEPKVLIFENTKKLVEAFTQHFIHLMKLKEGIFSVALSGGNTPKVWFEDLAKNHRDDIDWGRIHFYWGDERCVPPDDGESNYGMTKKYLLDYIDIQEKNIHRIHGERMPDEAAKIYSQELSENLSQDSVPIFDLVVLGMGDDGHTASIFPHQIDLWDSSDFCAIASHPSSGQRRVSLTGRVINSARSVAFLVTGENKAKKVHEILSREGVASNYPASLVMPEKSALYWFLDGAAARYLRDDT